MKKFIFVLAMCFLGVSLNAQVFSQKLVYDKFDDVIDSENIKSLVTLDEDEGTITIEEKGRQAQVYKVINWCDYASYGDKDNIVNIVNNVYGYQDTWCVVKENDYEDYSKILVSATLGDISKDDGTKQMSEMWLFITHRVIVSQYSHSYETEYWWIGDGESRDRTVYAK